MKPRRPPAPVSAAEFARRRRQLMRMAGEDAILVLPAAPERVRSHDTHHPYRQDSDFWYLGGFPEPEAVLVLVPGRAHGESLLFCRERDPAREQWDGPRAGTEGAVDTHGFDDAFPVEDLDDILPGLLEGRSRVYYHFGRDVEFDLRLIGWVKRVREQSRGRAQPPHEFLELGHLLHENRLFKSAAELRWMRHAARVSARAHAAAMRAVRPGMREFELEAVLQYEFRRHGGRPAYEPIVGAGANACILHHVRNDGPVRDGDLVLIDAGVELQGYAADISRTFPANGMFSREQRQLHDLVCAAQAAALDCARPGRTWIEPHQAAVAVLTEGLLSLGLLKGGLKRNLGPEGIGRFYMHKTGHWLGLDVHDVGDYRIDGEYRVLEPGMALTIEPGLYIAPGSRGVAAKWQGIGIRIEDDVVITADGHEVLSGDAPREADAVEALMASA